MKKVNSFYLSMLITAAIVGIMLTAFAYAKHDHIGALINISLAWYFIARIIQRLTK